MATTIAERKAKLEAQLRKIEAKEEREKNGRFIVIGQAVADLMDDDEEFHKTITQILDERVRKNPDREIVGLQKIKSNRGRPAKAKEEDINHIV